MVLKIRLKRKGKKKNPYYNIIITDSRSKRDGKFIEIVGTYNPIKTIFNQKYITLNIYRIKYWLKNGAKPSKKVSKILLKSNIFPY